jgi:riboflavin kinase/FMN adenylyltransferase
VIRQILTGTGVQANLAESYREPGKPLRGFSQRPGGYPTPTPQGEPRPPAATPVPTVMTFFPHPQEFFSGRSRPLLTPLPEKATQISRLGIDQLVLMPFTQALADLSPEAFVDILLVQQLRVQRISVGQDFCFGKRRQGTVDDLKTLAARHGIEVCIAPITCHRGDRISSSRIRQALAACDLVTVEALLGRPYSLSGRVVQGQQLGRTLGFPTANLSLPDDKYLPQHGVYSVWVQGSTQTPYTLAPGVMNIGNRPTVNGLATTIEVHLLNWSGDLYGKTLQVFLQQRLRPEQKFDSLDQLKAQIHQDCQRAIAALTKPPVGNWDVIRA